MKRCTKCGLEKAYDEFTVDRRSADGRSIYCRLCTRAIVNGRYAERREHSRKLANNRMARYRQRHSERVRKHRREGMRRWRKRHVMEARERSRWSKRTWKQRDPIGWRCAAARDRAIRRARLRAAQTDVAVDYRYICERDRMRCHLCRRRVAIRDLAFDHVIPLARGGGHVTGNIAVSHKECNRKKHANILTLF